MMTDLFWYLGSACPLRGGGWANLWWNWVKLHLFAIPVWVVALAKHISHSSGLLQMLKVNSQVHLPCMGRRHCHPASCCTWASILKFSEMTHTLARDSSGTELFLKSRRACCSSWHPKFQGWSSSQMVGTTGGILMGTRGILASGGIFHFCSPAPTFFREMVCLGNVVGKQLFSREKNVGGEKFSSFSPSPARISLCSQVFSVLHVTLDFWVHIILHVSFQMAFFPSCSLATILVGKASIAMKHF